MNTIKRYLEYQADRVEAVLAAHRAPARITGGTIGPRLIRFFVTPAPLVRFGKLRTLHEDLALALRVPNVVIVRGQDGIVFEIDNPEPYSITLKTLLKDANQLPVATCLLGIASDGSPLLARLSSPDVAHILVAGTTGSGKSVLLRAIVTSLALSNRANLLRFVMIDPKARTFVPFGGLQHLAREPVCEPVEILQALRDLVRLMEVRDRKNENPPAVPHVVVCIEELADVIMSTNGAAQEPITRLLQRGRESGIHVIAATQRPSAAILGGLMRANFPVRIVGRVVSADDARIASGRPGTNAHLLSGRGDFVCICNEPGALRFQGVQIDDKEIHDLLGTHNLTLTPSTNVMLPAVVPEKEKKLAPLTQDALNELRPIWGDVRDRWHNEYGFKSELCRQILRRPDSGGAARAMREAIAILEGTSTSTSTKTQTPISAQDTSRTSLVEVGV